MTPTVETASQEQTVTISADPRAKAKAIKAREKKIRQAMTAIHATAVQAAQARVPQINTKPDATAVSERGRLLRARKHYAKTQDRFLNRAQRRENARLVKFVD